MTTLIHFHVAIIISGIQNLILLNKQSFCSVKLLIFIFHVYYCQIRENKNWHYHKTSSWIVQMSEWTEHGFWQQFWRRISMFCGNFIIKIFRIPTCYPHIQQNEIRRLQVKISTSDVCGWVFTTLLRMSWLR
jgi:hypothetical protein